MSKENTATINNAKEMLAAYDSLNETYERIHSSQIAVDDYQRALRSQKTKGIAEHFDPYKAKPIRVSKRNGKYWCWDGQHTFCALLLLNGGKPLYVKCLVFHGLTHEHEARLFAEQDDFVQRVETRDKYKALYLAGDEAVVELKKAVEAHGIELSFRRQREDNTLEISKKLCVLFTKYPKNVFDEMLSLVTQAWNREAESFQTQILAGVHLFCMKYWEQFSHNTAVRKFSGITPTTVLRRGREFNENGTTKGANGYALALVKAYNNGLKTNRLDEKKLL